MTNDLQILSFLSLSPATCLPSVVLTKDGWRGRIEHRVSGIVHRLLLAARGEGRARKKNKNMQNEPNFKNDQIDITARSIYSYGNLIAFSRPQNEAKRTQNEPNFSPKLGSFFPKLALNKFKIIVNRLKIWYNTLVSGVSRGRSEILIRKDGKIEGFL